MATTRTKKKTAAAPANPADPDWLTWIPESPDGQDSYWVQSRGLALSLVLIAPLILAYEVALIWYAKPTGAGRFMKSVFYEVFHNHAGMVLNIVLAMFVLLAIIVLARRRRLRRSLARGMATGGQSRTRWRLGVGHRGTLRVCELGFGRAE